MCCSFGYNRALFLGLFNSVDEWEGVDVDGGERAPSFGTVDFEMTYVVHRPCKTGPGTFSCLDVSGTRHRAMVTDNQTNTSWLEVTYNVAGPRTSPCSAIISALVV